jgi:hypothetical protein
VLSVAHVTNHLAHQILFHENVEHSNIVLDIFSGSDYRAGTREQLMAEHTAFSITDVNHLSGERCSKSGKRGSLRLVDSSVRDTLRQPMRCGQLCPQASS